MAAIKIPYMKVPRVGNPISRLSQLLDNIPKYKIDQAPWPEYPYKPEVSFAIAYDEKNIALKYYVAEKAIAATETNTNSPVHKDACVEFFISFDDQPYYYNLEFNCIGTCHAGYGNSRANRKLLSTTLIDQIERQCCITKGIGTANTKWELTLKIPLTTFTYDSHIESLRDRHCRVNFYKCGDELPEPHFLAWNPIESPAPDFHLPAFFGLAHFN